MRILTPEHFGHTGIDNNGASVVGSNQNIDRGDTYSQPMALKKNDELSGGQRLIHDPRNTNDGVSILLKDDRKRYVPLRLALQLGDVTENAVLPQDLRVGDVLQTGCVVLAESVELTGEGPYCDTNDQFNVRISLSGGQRPQTIATPSDLYLARFGTLDDLRPDSAMTYITLSKLRHLRRSLLDKSLRDFSIIGTL